MKLSVILLVIIILLNPVYLWGSDCSETVEINGEKYWVPDKWCGKKLDSTQVADKNKLVPLPDEITFEDYRIYVLPEVREALVKMAEDAGKAGILLLIDSGFRSAAYQKKIIERRLENGEPIERIIRMVAPPGYSQHETGRAVDFVPSEAVFIKTVQYKWLKENADKFGFVEYYYENNPDSIFWEPYHWFYQADEN